MSVLLAPHCWNDTSFADPEYVMDFTSPSAFWALAMTALASCAVAFPLSHARPIAIKTSFLTTEPPYNGCGLYSEEPSSANRPARLTKIFRSGLLRHFGATFWSPAPCIPPHTGQRVAGTVLSTRCA